MVDLSCSQEGCTIAETGVCANTGEASPCELATGSVEDDIAQELSSAEIGKKAVGLREPVIAETEGVMLHPGIELGLGDLSDLMARHHSRLVGILGESNTGKTMFLTALYLALSCRKGEPHGYTFAGSLTLPGFEDRARLSRKWAKPGEGLPERMSIHTQSADGRSAGFLHLDVVEASSRRRSRLLLSDLPGEWTSELIINARHAERLSFLARADAILILIDGPSLMGSTRHATEEEHRMLIDRVADICGDQAGRMAIVATKGDEIDLTQPTVLTKLVEHARAKGFDAKPHTIASISRKADIESGAGVVELLSWLLQPERINYRAEGRHSAPRRLFGWLPVTFGSSR
jgi:GTP-binding protein EngB required for normal cell division